MTATCELRAGQMVRPPHEHDPVVVLVDVEPCTDSVVRVRTSGGWMCEPRFAGWEEVVEC